MSIFTIELTGFARGRHFDDPEFRGTKVLDHSPEKFVGKVNELLRAGEAELAEGYAPFCQHAFVKNFTDARLGSAPITPDNEHLLKSGYEARTPEELPVLTRWFEGDEVSVPRAEWLDVILYDRQQLAEEGIDIEAEYGIVAVLGVPTPEEPPLDPNGTLRNALGSEYGGSGVPIDRASYARSVEFWSNYALVR